MSNVLKSVEDFVEDSFKETCLCCMRVWFKMYINKLKIKSLILISLYNRSSYDGDFISILLNTTNILNYSLAESFHSSSSNCENTDISLFLSVVTFVNKPNSLFCWTCNSEAYQTWN